jgi:hypothetical protein
MASQATGHAFPTYVNTKNQAYLHHSPLWAVCQGFHLLLVQFGNELGCAHERLAIIQSQQPPLVPEWTTAKESDFHSI